MSNRQPHQLSTTARGYGNRHQAKRREVAKLVNAGLARCCRCGERIAPRSQWHLDHADVPRAHELSIYAGPSHKACNLAWRNRRQAALARQALGGPRADTRTPSAAAAFFNPPKRPLK